MLLQPGAEITLATLMSRSDPDAAHDIAVTIAGVDGLGRAVVIAGDSTGAESRTRC